MAGNADLTGEPVDVVAAERLSPDPSHRGRQRRPAARRAVKVVDAIDANTNAEDGFGLYHSTDDDPRVAREITSITLRAADALAVNVPMSVVNANASAHVTISHLILSDPDNDSRMGED